MDILTIALIIASVLIVGIVIFYSNRISKLKQQNLTLENKNRQSEEEYQKVISSQNNLMQEINKLKKQNEYNDAVIRNIQNQSFSTTNNTDSYTNTNNHHTNTSHTNIENTTSNIATNNDYINNSKSINNNMYVSNIQNYDINIHGLLSFLQQNLEEQGRRDAMQSHDRSQIEIKKQSIYQEVMSHIVQVKNYYKKKIEDHQYKEDYHYKLGTEDTAQEIASSKKKLLDELQEVEKIEKEIKENTNHQYQILILSYQKGFRETVSILSQMKLGIKTNNEN